MIKIYTTSWCPHCQNAKQLLKEKGYQFDEIDIEKVNMSRPQLAEITGGSSVPQIVINDKPIGGFTNLLALDQKGELKELVEL